jgi:hypothetical protein
VDSVDAVRSHTFDSKSRVSGLSDVLSDVGAVRGSESAHDVDVEGRHTLSDERFKCLIVQWQHNRARTEISDGIDSIVSSNVGD